MHRNRQQCLVALRVRARARECIFPVLKVTKTFVLRVSGNCEVRGVRTTAVCNVTVMYCREQYMENVPIVAFLCALAQLIKAMATLPELSLLNCHLVWKQKCKIVTDSAKSGHSLTSHKSQYHPNSRC